MAAGLAQKCVIQLAYAIGVAKPLSVYVDTFGTATVDEDKLASVIQEVVDLSLAVFAKGSSLAVRYTLDQQLMAISAENQMQRAVSLGKKPIWSMG